LHLCFLLVDFLKKKIKLYMKNKTTHYEFFVTWSLPSLIPSYPAMTMRYWKIAGMITTRKIACQEKTVSP